MQLRIISPERELLNVEADRAILPGQDGQMEILPGHARLAALLQAGTIIFFRDNKQEQLETNGGIAEVAEDKLLILT